MQAQLEIIENQCDSQFQFARGLDRIFATSCVRKSSCFPPRPILRRRPTPTLIAECRSFPRLSPPTPSIGGKGRNWRVNGGGYWMRMRTLFGRGEKDTGKLWPLALNGIIGWPEIGYQQRVTNVKWLHSSAPGIQDGIRRAQNRFWHSLHRFLCVQTRLPDLAFSTWYLLFS